MARRRSRTKRRSLRSFGAVLINAGGPRRRRRRKNPPARNRLSKKQRKTYSKSVKRHARGKSRVRGYTRRPTRKYKGKRVRRRAHAWKYKYTGKKRYLPKSRPKYRLTRKKKARRNPRRRRITRARRAPIRRRRITRARRNPAFVSKIQSSVKKLPFIGGPAATVVGFAPHAAIGAVSLEAPLMLLKQAWFQQSKVGQFFADKPHWFLAASGALLGLAASYAPIGSVATKQRVAIALASAGAGAGYFAWKQNQGDAGALTLGNVLTSAYSPAPVGALTLGGVGAYGEAPAVTVSPIGAGYGAVVLGGV